MEQASAWRLPGFTDGTGVFEETPVGLVLPVPVGAKVPPDELRVGEEVFAPRLVQAAARVASANSRARGRRGNMAGIRNNTVGETATDRRRAPSAADPR
jgi:hypothetical protein